jgi:signal transduction histidine kinase/CheY-like chemotaxis protein/HAMP domain-containing protein
MKRRSIASRYAVLVAALLAVALIVSGALETWSSHRDRQAIAESLQRDKARAAAVAVARFLEDVQRSLQWATLSVPIAGGESPAQRRIEFIKLLRLEPAITTVTLIDAEGAERLQVSRITPDRLGSGVDWSRHPGWATARSAGTYFSSTYFAAQSEPYLTIAVPAAARDGSVVIAEVNLKFVSNVVSEIKIGATGYAYVVDASGRLVSHPDISFVLQMSDLSKLPQVQAAAGIPRIDSGFHTVAHNLAGTRVFAAHAAIKPVGWTIFVEQLREEALAPLASSIVRTGLILAVALLLALVAGVLAARKMVAPIAKLRAGALRFGAGELDHRIEVSSGDELEDLAILFNAMAGQLRETYSDLERRVLQRTQELHERNDEITEALEQQTATAGILRVISSSPTDALPVFQTIVEAAARLCDANFAFVMLDRDGWLSLAARTNCTPEFATYLQNGFPADRTTTTGRAVLARQPVQVLDLSDDEEVLVTAAHRSEQVRTVLAVPLVREDSVLGVIAVWRRDVLAFSERQIKLLETFADQAVIAVENLRMFDQIQQKSRELLLANQAKSRFLAAASHDLRQPMHALSLFVGQLSSARTQDERAVLTGRIEKAVGSLSDLLDQLLDLSKLDAGAVQVMPSDFPIRNVLAEVEVQFAAFAHSKGLQFRVASSFAWLRSDEMLVRRILLNLVGNAIRYTQRGGVLIGCRRRGDKLRIAVWDTGCGIPDDRREDIFREFVQLDPIDAREAAERGRGLGLGLAIVARTAELLRTQIELHTTVGRGSAFFFELPLGVPSTAAQPSPEPLRLTELRGTFALVIDDDEAARAATCGLLKSWGCLTLAAADASEAIAELAAHDRPPEIIVCDYWLGAATSGLQAITQLRATLGEDLPAILVTADTTKAVASEARALGVPLLHKPVSPVKLRALLVMLLATGDGQRVAA